MDKKTEKNDHLADNLRVSQRVFYAPLLFVSMIILQSLWFFSLGHFSGFAVSVKKRTDNVV